MRLKQTYVKPMNNSVFGKSMDSHKNMKLTTKEQIAVKYVSKNTFKGARYTDVLYMVGF